MNKTHVTSLFLILAVLSLGSAAFAGDTHSKTGEGTATTTDTNCKTHCELPDLVKRCSESEKKSIKCIDELISSMEKAKSSKKKKDKDEALDKAVLVLNAVKKQSENTICVMEIIEKRNRELKEHAKKVKDELNALDSMFDTSAPAPFMWGPYF